MGLNVTNAYHQIFANTQAAKAYNPASRKGREAGSGKSVPKDDAGVSVSFSKGGLEALDNAKDKVVPKRMKSLAEENESKLSEKAKAYLDKLREKYGDSAFDFVVGSESDDVDALVADSEKDYSFVLSNEDLERMADDEEYEKKMIGKAEEAVTLGDQFKEEALKQGVSVGKISFSIGEDGTISMFAELEKAAEERAEKIKDSVEERRKEQKEEAKKEAGKETERSVDEDPLVKRATVQGKSVDELLEQLGNINWNLLTATK